MNLVFFDIDGTLIRGASVERRFFTYLIKKRLLGMSQVASYLREAKPAFVAHGRRMFQKNKAYFCGIPVAAVESAANEWVHTRLIGRWNQSVLRALQWHLQRGDEVVLLSGAPDVLANALAKRLAVTRVIATTFDASNGRYTTQSLRVHPFGEEKRQLASRLASDMGIPANRVVAYADSKHDKALLTWAGVAVAVAPDQDLAAVANCRNWKVLT